MADRVNVEANRQPYSPPDLAEWQACFAMLCSWCARQGSCQIVEDMIAMSSGGAWPEGGWVTDPGAGMTCLSYDPRPGETVPRQQRRAIARMKEPDLPPVCGGCAALKGSEASVSLHTRRDYQAAVRNGTRFACHEDPELKRPCGGWCRAIAKKNGRRSVC